MRVPVTCWQCSFDGAVRFVHYLPLSDDAAFEINCHEHGSSVVQLQNARFELFFESAILALADARSREAVLDFAASFERFGQFFISFVRAHYGVADNEFAQFWKTIASQSERQLGAFHLSQLLVGSPSTSYPKPWAELRNKVVHKGYIPTTGEVATQGEALRCFMYEVLDHAKILDERAIFRASSYEHESIAREPLPDPEGPQCTSLSVPTVLGIWHVGVISDN